VGELSRDNLQGWGTGIGEGGRGTYKKAKKQKSKKAKKQESEKPLDPFPKIKNHDR
jgi:hypothetical protein